MNQQIQQLRGYVRMVWPYRWAALATVLAFSVMGWIYVYTLPNQYEVSAKIFVDTRSMLRPVLRGLAIDTRMLEDSAMLMRRTLLTRPNLEEVARRTDLDLKAQTSAQFDKIIEGLATRIQLSGTRDTDIFSITYTDRDAQQAKRVIDELLNIFLESTLGDTRKDTALTQRFLDQQIAEYERKLIEAEERLKEFKRKNMGVMPGTDSDYFGRLQANEAQLAEAKLALREAVNRREAIRRQLAGEEPVFGIMGDAAITSPELQHIEARIRGLQQRLDELLLNYTEKHPDVVAIKQTMETLEAEKAAELAALKEAGFGAQSVAADQNPVYQDMKVALAQADAEVAALETRVAEYEERGEELRKLVNTVPEVEAELKRLNRDYGLHKEQYEALIQRREATRIAEEADKTSDDIKLKVIEPPRVPLVPVGPDRLRLLGMVLFVSLGAGGGVAFLLSQLNPRVFSSDGLKQLTGLPVMGVVTLLQSDRQRAERRMELAVFSLMLLMVMAGYAALVALQFMHVDVHEHLTELVGRGA